MARARPDAGAVVTVHPRSVRSLPVRLHGLLGVMLELALRAAEADASTVQIFHMPNECGPPSKYSIADRALKGGVHRDVP